MNTQKYINEIKNKILQHFPTLIINVSISDYDGEVEFSINNKEIFNLDEFNELAWDLYVEYNNKLENGIGLILDENIPDLTIGFTAEGQSFQYQLPKEMSVTNTISKTIKMPSLPGRSSIKVNASFNLNDLPVAA